MSTSPPWRLGLALGGAGGLEGLALAPAHHPGGLGLALASGLDGFALAGGGVLSPLEAGFVATAAAALRTLATHPALLASSRELRDALAAVYAVAPPAAALSGVGGVGNDGGGGGGAFDVTSMTAALRDVATHPELLADPDYYDLCDALAGAAAAAFPAVPAAPEASAGAPWDLEGGVHGWEGGAGFVGVPRGVWGPEAVAGGAAADHVWSLASLGGGLVAVGHGSGAVRVRDAATGAATAALLGHADTVRALVALPGGGRVASASADRSVRVWRLATGACEAMLAGHTAAVSSLAVLRNGQLVSGSVDGTARLWDPAARACTAVLAHDSPVWSLAALASGGLAAGCGDGRVALWSAAGERVASLGGGAGFGRVLSLSALPDGRLAAGYTNAPCTGAGGPSLIRVWDLQRCALDAELAGHANWVWSLLALPDGRLLSGSRDKTAKVWAAPPPDAPLDAPPPDAPLDAPPPAALRCVATLEGHTGEVFALARLPDGCAASGSRDGTVRVWA